MENFYLLSNANMILISFQEKGSDEESEENEKIEEILQLDAVRSLVENLLVFNILVSFVLAPDVNSNFELLPIL